MTYTIPLSPKCLEWLSKQPESTQALVGWTLTNRGIPRYTGETNHDATVEDLKRMMVYYWGTNYPKRAEGLGQEDDLYDFVPAHRHPLLWHWFYRALPFIFVFLFGLACGLDWA